MGPTAMFWGRSELHRWLTGAACLAALGALVSCSSSPPPSRQADVAPQSPPAVAANVPSNEGGNSVHQKDPPRQALPRQARLEPSRARIEPPRPRPYSAGIRKIGPTREAATRLVDFETAPFPYAGTSPGGRPFLDVVSGDRKGHRSSRGRVFWEDETFGDRRVLLHVPTGFDIDKPGLMVLFFHGHGAKIERDVRDRQLLPSQINAAGINAVLMAPQFAIDAADSSAGRFWEPGGCERFRREAAQKFSRIYGGDAASEQAFLKMPMVIMAYSGGYAPAASCLRNGQLQADVRGIVLFDALYGEMDTYRNWVLNNRSGFFLSTYTGSTQRLNEELDRQLNDRDIDTHSAMAGYNARGRVTFVKVPPDADHRSLMTKAWAKNPVRDMMAKFEEYRVSTARARLAGQ